MIGAKMRTSRGPDAQGPAQQWSSWGGLLGGLLGGSAGSVGGCGVGITLGRVDSGQAVYRVSVGWQPGTVWHSPAQWAADRVQPAAVPPFRPLGSVPGEHGAPAGSDHLHAKVPRRDLLHLLACPSTIRSSGPPSPAAREWLRRMRYNRVHYICRRRC